MNREIQHLKKMRDLLAKGWTQGALARNQSGRKVTVMSAKAASFCIMGALHRICGELRPRLNVYYKIYELTKTDVAEWNNDPNRTQSEVLALIDRAIEIAEAE